MQAMNEVSDLDTNMTINAYMIGLRPDSQMEVSLNIQKVSTLSEFLSRAKLYTEFEDILLAKRSNFSTPLREEELLYGGEFNWPILKQMKALT